MNIFGFILGPTFHENMPNYHAYIERQRNVMRAYPTCSFGIPLTMKQQSQHSVLHSLCVLESVCHHCNAHHFRSGKTKTGTFMKCCHNGKIHL